MMLLLVEMMMLLLVVFAAQCHLAAVGVGGIYVNC